jgi:hypothetical protein
MEAADAPSGTVATEVGHRASRLAGALFTAAVAFIVLASTIMFAELRTDERWAPLGNYPEQTVTSRVAELEGAPAVHLGGQTVDTTGEKCADADVDVLATVSWKPVDPLAGSIVVQVEHAGHRDEGCVVNQWQNEIPPQVRAAARRQHERGVEAPLWVIRGVEIPVSDAHGRGIPAVWQTEPFAILAAEVR